MNVKDISSLIVLMRDLASKLKSDKENTGNDIKNDLSIKLLKCSSSIRQLLNVVDKLKEKNISCSEELDFFSLIFYPFFKKTERIIVGYDILNAKDFKAYKEDLHNLKNSLNQVSVRLNARYSQHKENIYFESGEIPVGKDDINSMYIKAKGLVDDILKDSSSVTIALDKLHLQQSKINELEKKYRKALTTISINEDEYQERRDTLEKSFLVANDFLDKQKIISSDIEKLNKETADSIGKIRRLSKFAGEHEKSYEKNLSDLNELIDKTKEIMGNASAAKLGEHFKIQYDSSKRFLALWPSLSGFFLICAVVICLLTVFPEFYVNIFGGSINEHYSSGNIPFIISRLLVAPLFLAGTWFCAGQYIKQKNITEDYAYKKVLSLSLLSIKNEIEKTGEKNTADFIRAIQGEIVKSPLDSLDRKHYKNEIKLLRSVQSDIMKNIMHNAPKDKKNKNKSSLGQEQSRG